MPWMAGCALCGAPSVTVVCPGCDADLPRIRLACRRCGLPAPGIACGPCSLDPPPWHLCVAPFLFDFPLDRIMHAYKYRGSLYWADFLAANMVRHIRMLALPLPRALVPVPMTAGRMAHRGFNQAWELARRMGAELDIHVMGGGLRRLRAEASQVGLDADARRTNVRSAFTADGTTRVPESVAVVDDLVTTGATARAVAEQLRLQGARQIQVWAAARTPPRR
jgi:ComF family protein